MTVELSDQTKYSLVGFLRTYPNLYWASLVPIVLLYFYPMVSFVTSAGIFGYVLTRLLIMEGRISLREFVKMVALPPEFSYFGIERLVFTIVLSIAISVNTAKIKLASVTMVAIVMFILNWARYLDPDSKTYWNNTDPIYYREKGIPPRLSSFSRIEPSTQIDGIDQTKVTDWGNEQDEEN